LRPSIGGGSVESRPDYTPARGAAKLRQVFPCSRPGEWETLDITLTGRWVTVVRDGVTIIGNEEIPGITGGSLDSHEDAPGPFNLQGTHAAGIRFRNLTISVPRRT
jgi:hypothetical protein